MENEDSVDVVSTDVSYSDTAEAGLSDYEDDSESKCSGFEGSDDSVDSDDGDDSDAAAATDDDEDKDDRDDSARVNAEVNVGDRMVRINSITADEIAALEFSNVEEAYEFYYRYGKCKGFSVRKHDRRYGGPKSNRKLYMKKFVCSKQGLRDKKHLCRVDRKRDHRRLTRSDCKARLRVNYKPNKGKYVVSLFEEGHNHELTPSQYVHLHPVFRKISASDKAQIDSLQSHGREKLKIAAEGGYNIAKYVYGMIMLCSENDESRNEGIKHIRYLRMNKCLFYCRRRMYERHSYFWSPNGMLVRNQTPVCKSRPACGGWRLKKGLWVIQDDEDDDLASCEYCRCDEELKYFYSMFNIPYIE
ncbi:hypothetical protein P8452_58615 [Trifolium repens]|nr:hypothetical protein P8452_58615 [Trifolium repens]